VQWLNYHHLRYFWVVAKHGSLQAAGKVLHVSHPTISAQIHALEDQMGQKLFEKSGRRLVLTDVGRIAYRYAEEIFGIGRDLMDAMSGQLVDGNRRLDVGVVDAVPKLVVQQLLAPALEMVPPVRLHCHEDRFDKLLSDLALGAVDVVISDAPIPTGSSIRAFHHLLGDSSVSIFGVPALAKKHKRGFPESLNGAPFLVPSDNSALRRDLNHWFDRRKIQPRIVAEFDDSALLKVFAAQGHGLFAAPSVVADQVCTHYGVQLLGEVSGVRERFYVVSLDRKVKHPAVVAISDSARRGLFAA
jgi:LysR family transcriptional regulator, transcriptional activator of nhaA